MQKKGVYLVADDRGAVSLHVNVLQTLTHEIGHIFGLRHCQWLACLMQGSNHLEEADQRPLDLCPICLRKLQSAIGFHLKDRYKVSGGSHKGGSGYLSSKLPFSIRPFSGGDLSEEISAKVSRKLWFKKKRKEISFLKTLTCLTLKIQ